MMCCDKDALLPSIIQCNAVQMSERLQDLERAVTSGAAADGDGSTTSKRSLSVSMTRKPSLIIRRTLSSFRWAFPHASSFAPVAQHLQRDVYLVQLCKSLSHMELDCRQASAQLPEHGA